MYSSLPVSRSITHLDPYAQLSDRVDRSIVYRETIRLPPSALFIFATVITIFPEVLFEACPAEDGSVTADKWIKIVRIIGIIRFI